MSSTLNQSVFLCGGKGTRLGALTQNRPKPLLEVGGRPFLMHLLERATAFGIEEAVLLVGPYQSLFEEAIRTAAPPGLRTRCISEPAPAGTAGALRYAAMHLAPRFLLMNGDTYFAADWRAFAKVAGDTTLTIAVREAPDAGRYGAVITDANGRVRAFGEKSVQGPGQINCGLYAVDRDILKEIPPGTHCSLENDVIPRLVSEGRVAASPIEGPFLDIGTPEDFGRAARFIRDINGTH
jgi:D-glycero-D-manno-heptose 1,7-bisphosphate phosphatase